MTHSSQIQDVVSRALQQDELRFRTWYSAWADELDLDQDPDNPLHQYDYRAAWVSGAQPERNETGEWHWPSEFKAEGHPNRFVGGYDTRTGKKVSPQEQAAIQARVEQESRAAVGEAWREARRLPGMLPVEDLKIKPEKMGLVGATGKALMGGFAAAGKNLLVNAPRAGQEIIPRVLSEAAAMTGAIPRTERKSFEAAGREATAPLRQAVRAVTAPVERAAKNAELVWQSQDPRDQGGFAEQFAANPGRALTLGLAQNAPQLLITIGAAAVNPVVGLAVAGSSEAGAAYDEAKEAGASDEDAALTAGLVALPNMALEYLPAGKLLKKAVPGAPTKGFSQALGRLFSQAASEGSTEMLQETNNVVAGLAVYAGDRGLSWNDLESVLSAENLERVGAAGLYGAIMGGGVSGIGGGDERAAAPPTDRRVDLATRRRVAEMAPEEMKKALLTNEATGLPNRRAWEEEAADRPFHVAVDVDSLKWVNDRFGHDAGTNLLRAIGGAVGPLGGYHLQGDEFALSADSEEAALQVGAQLDANLQGVRLRYTASDGTVYEVPIGATYGIGPSYKEADLAAAAAKEDRTSRGLRSARGEAPPGLVAVPPSGRPARSRASKLDLLAPASVAAPPSTPPLAAPESSASVPFAAQAGAEAPIEGRAQRLRSAVVGSADSTVSERGREVGFSYAVVEADEAIASHDLNLRLNPAYPQEVQPRDRSRAASETQVMRMEANLRPEWLGRSPRISDGAPILGPDGVVESGNGRTIAVQRAYARSGDASARYRQWLEQEAETFGIDSAAIGSFSKPLLVRVRQTPVGDRAEFAREANEAAVAAFSATERARSDAEAVTPDLVATLEIPDSGEINWNANRDFVRAFIARAAPNEVGVFVDDRGQLSAEGQVRLRNALLAKAYGDPDAIAKIVEHTDSKVRNVGQALLREAPRTVRLRTEMEQGALYPRDLSADASAALSKLSALRSQGQKVDAYLAQAQMFTSELSPESRELLAAYDNYAKSPRQLADIFRRYGELVESLGDPRQGGLFATTQGVPSKLELLREAIRTNEQAGQGGPFNRPSPQVIPGQSEGGFLKLPQGRPPAPAVAAPVPKFTGAGVEQIFQTNRRTPFSRDQTVRARLRNALHAFRVAVTRENEHLPHGGEWSPAREVFRWLGHQPNIQAERTAIDFERVFGNLTTGQRELFEKAAAVESSQATLAKGKPAPLSQADVDADGPAILAAAAADPYVAQARDAMREVWAKSREEYAAAREALGLSTDFLYEYGDSYMHHQVLQYMDDNKSKGSRKVSIPKGRGWQKHRTGTAGLADINWNYVGSQIGVVTQMRTDTKKLEALKRLDDQYGIEESVKAEERGRVDLANRQEQLDYLRRLAARPRVPAATDFASRALSEIEEGKNVNVRRRWLALPREVREAVEQDSDFGAFPERERPRHILAIANDGDLPEGFAPWQPDAGRLMYTAMSVPERIAASIIEKGIGEVASADIKEVLALGGPKNTWVLPQEVVNALKATEKHLDDGALKMLSEGSAAVMKGWKVWTLFNPRRWVKYATRNIVGDAEKVAVGNPASFKHAPRAARELFAYIYGSGQEVSPELQAFIGLGGFGSSQFSQELGLKESGRLKSFETEMGAFVDQVARSPKTAAKGYFRFVTKNSQFLEALLRYSTFLDYRAQLQAGSGKPKNYGASIPEEVDALVAAEGEDAGAFWLANELVGAYDMVSQLGQTARRHFIPFFSFPETAVKGYYRLLRNAMGSERVGADLMTSAPARRAFGSALVRAAPFQVIKAGKFLAKAYALEALLAAWNEFKFPDDEKDLPAELRHRPHIVYGRNDDGSVAVFDRLGVFQEVRSWFGLEDFGPAAIMDYLNGRHGPVEIARGMLDEVLSKAVSGVGPYFKVPAELLAGRTTFPSVLQRRELKDPADYLARTMSAEEEFRALSGRPQRRGVGAAEQSTEFRRRLETYLTTWRKALPVYDVHSGEAANDDTLALKDTYLRKIGAYSRGSHWSPKSEALRNAKAALRLNDEDALEHYLALYVKRGGTAEGLDQSMEGLHPLRGLNDDQKEEFVKWLSPAGRDTLFEAVEHWEEQLKELEKYLQDHPGLVPE